MTTGTKKRIGLIHALAESVDPAHAAFEATWPEATCFDLSDTSLAVDRAAVGYVDQAMMDRFSVLAEYASSSEGVGGKTVGLLFTCSAFGPAIERVKKQCRIPVLSPNEAAFAEALTIGPRIGLIVTFHPSLGSLTEELQRMAEQAGVRSVIHGALASGALAALKRDDAEEHDRSIAEVAAAMPTCDVIILGQFSMARAARLVRQRVEIPVLTTPESAVQHMKKLTSKNEGAQPSGS